MYKLFFIAKNNLIKKKSDAAVLSLLIMLAALLLYTSVSVLTHTTQVIENAYEKANTADFLYVSSCPETEKISAYLKNHDGVQAFERAEGISAASVECHKEGGQEKTTSFLIEKIETAGEICKVPEINKPQKKSMLLPYYMKHGEGIAEGDKFYLAFGEASYEFTVAGFLEDPLFSTPLNINVFRCYITEQFYEELLDKEPELEMSRCWIYKLKVDGETDLEDFDADVTSGLPKEIPKLAGAAVNLGLNGKSMKFGAAYMSNIGMGILLVFSALLICIALIIIRFSIKNFMEGNLKNIGILMASGYTAKQLAGISCLEMSGLSVISSAAGVLLGGFMSKTVGNIEASLIGLRWNLPFDVAAALLVFLSVNLVVLSATLLTAGVYGRIEILEALRGGIKTHHFWKNVLPLDKTRLPLPPALGIKSILGAKRKNAAVMGIVGLLSFACCIGFALYQNFGSSDEKLVELFGIEIGTAIVTGSDLEEIGKQAEAWDNIERVLYYDFQSVKLSSEDKNLALTCEFWKEPKQNMHSMIVQGRLPEHDNEIGLTALVAERLNVKLGDVIYAEGRQERKDYIVTCIDQKVEELGMRASMTMEGAERINGVSAASQLYIYADEGLLYAELEKRLLEEFDAVTVVDSEKNIETMFDSVKMIITLLCTVFAAATVVIISLVLILLIKTKITREWKLFGISKALGFTTRQIILQIQMGLLPVIFTGAVLGAGLSVCLLNPLVEACLAMAGIVQSDLRIHPVWLALSICLIMTVSAAVSFLCAYRVRKIEPVKMLSEE